MTTMTITPPEDQLRLPPSAEASDGDEQLWSVVFVFSEMLTETERAAMLDHLDGSAAFVLLDDELRLAVGGTGAMDQALAQAGAQVNAALARTETEARIVEARMVPHSDAHRQMSANEPVTYYGVTECAHALGVTRQRVQQLLKEAKLPAPDAEVKGRPLWRESRFLRFAAQRIESIAHTPLGHRPSLDDPDNA